MAIPFFSIDLTLKEYLIILRDLIVQPNKKPIEKEIKKELSKRFPNKFISLLPSGRLGFYLTLKNLFKANDLVIFSSMSFPLYIKIALQLKLKVKLIDIDEKDLNIDLDNLKNIDLTDCKGIVVTHLFGNPCQIEEIKKICDEKNIILIEDCAQSFDSKFNGIHTGNYGDAGIISTSLLKIPTTLSGGILVTSNNNLYQETEKWIKENLSNDLIEKIKLLFKTLIFILNSYPLIYSILSDKVFSLLRNYNPRIYRKILYSGMGVKNSVFNPKERPNLSRYQLSVGLSQIRRSEEMLFKRRENSKYLQKKLEKNKNIRVINNHYNNEWNHQYFVIQIKKNFNLINEKIFKDGIHAMDENVWNCTKYNFNFENKDANFKITNYYDGSLLRIQNNSFLKKNQIKKIAKIILDSCNENNK